MLSRFRRPAGLLLAFACATLAWAQSDADLKDYRTVENAITAQVVKAKKATQQPAYLGVQVGPYAGDRLVVTEVAPGSAAAQAGVQKGDILIQSNGTKFTTPAAFREWLQGSAPGDAVTLAIERGNKSLDLKATLAAASRPLTLSAERASLGVRVADAGGDTVKITDITSGSPGEKIGLKKDDLLLKIGNTDIGSPARLFDVLAEKKPGDKVSITYKRGDKEPVQAEVLLTRDTPGKGFFGGGQGWDSRTNRGTWKKDVYRLAVVIIEYPDVKHSSKISTKDWEESLFSKGTYKNKKSVTGQPVHGSLNDYYNEISYGKFRVEGKVFDPVAVGKKRPEYAQTANKGALLGEALDKLLERDGADVLKTYDGIFFMYAGNRFATQRGGLYWPHRSSHSHKGKQWSYFICPEGGDKMDSISVIAHEFGHMLGLPDLYARPESPGSEGLGVWCTMSNGHGRDGKPLHFSAWCKEQLGWLEPVVIDPTVKQKLILRPVQHGTKECFKVLVRPDGSEYLLLENRAKQNFDRDLPAEGLLIWRVNANRPLLEESHGIAGPPGPRVFMSSVPYPSPSNNAFTPSTTPSSRSPNGGGLPVHITNIQRLPDGRVTFHIGYEYY